MIDALRLHYAPDNASLCVRLALEASQTPYETVLVNRGTDAQRSTEFLALNPNGLIPVLETPDGPMFETAAILMWLSDGQPDLFPPLQDRGRTHAIQWLFWLSNTLHTTLRRLFYPDQYVIGKTEPLHSRAKTQLVTHLDILERSETAPWLDSAELSAHACYLGPMLRWAALYGSGPDWFELGRWPRLAGFAKRVEAHHAVEICAEAEGLGPTPFSAPHPCKPPEGQAL